MGRRSKSLEEYIELASKNDLEFVATTPPTMTRKSTEWRCRICGRVLNRSYNKVKYGSACVCRTSVALKKEDYNILAMKLGIQWVGELLPMNIMHKTQWRNKENVIFEASYHSMGYGKIKKELQQYISNNFTNHKKLIS